MSQESILGPQSPAKQGPPETNTPQAEAEPVSGELEAETDTTARLVRARGRDEIEAHRAGASTTRRQAMLGKCFDCMGGYRDGKVDCRVPACPLYPWMPYRE
jgi:hypothetical protein